MEFGIEMLLLLLSNENFQCLCDRIREKSIWNHEQIQLKIESIPLNGSKKKN